MRPSFWARLITRGHEFSGASVGGGYYHSWAPWTESVTNEDHWDSLDDTVYTQFLLRVHPRQGLLGYHQGNPVYRSGAHNGAFVFGLEPAVQIRSPLQAGGLMTLAQAKVIFGWQF